MKQLLAIPVTVAAALALLQPASTIAGDSKGINLVLNEDVSDEILDDLTRYGKIRLVLPQIRGVSVQADIADFEEISQLPYVADAAPDGAAERDFEAEMEEAVVDSLPDDADEGADGPLSLDPPGIVSGLDVEDCVYGMSTWDLDAINVTEFGLGRIEPYTGEGVYVAVIDGGLTNDWPAYFPASRIATEYAISFGGGGNENGNVSVQPNKWGTAKDSHGTQVTSAVLGYFLPAGDRCRWTKWGEYTCWQPDDVWCFNGVAPRAKVIPVDVFGAGWWSVIATGITYVADLKAGPLKDHPVVINLSLGGNEDPIAKAAIDYAISQGVVVVAAAGNENIIAPQQGLRWPASYEPVISVGSVGWQGAWMPAFDLQNLDGANQNWWIEDVPEPAFAELFPEERSSRAIAGQDLDVGVPGWSFGPRSTQNGKLQYNYVISTSQATPRVCGIVALMLEKNPMLKPCEAEQILEAAATKLPHHEMQFLRRTWLQNHMGYRVVNTFWDDDAIGHGVITADRALDLTP